MHHFLLQYFIFLALLNADMDPRYWSWGSSATRWSIWVYRREANTHIKACAMICTYETDCDFYVFWNNECCFGKFSHATGSQFTTSSMDVYFKIGNEEISVPNYYDPKNGDQNDATKGIMHNWYWRHNVYYR